MDVSISCLMPSDAEIIGPEHNRIWRTAYAGLIPPERLANQDDAEAVRRWLTRAQQHDQLGRSVEGATTWVARDSSGRPLGWMTVGSARDLGSPCDVELWSLYVVPELWGGGVAAALMDARLPPGRAMLWVLQGNERAIAFYRKRGFEIDGGTKYLDPVAGPGGGVELRMVRS